LACTWIFTAFVFSKPEQYLGYITYVMYIPALVAIPLAYIQHRSLRDLVKPIIHRIPISVLVFSIMYPILFLVLCAAITYVINIAEFNREQLTRLIDYPAVTILLIGFLKVFGEEYGWRAYLLHEMAEKKGPVTASIFVGVVWAAFHGPIVYQLATYLDTGNPLLICIVQMAAVFVFSFPFAYTYLASGSVIPPMIFHFVWNLYNPKILGNIYFNQPGIMSGNILLINGEGVAGIVLGIVFVFWYLKNIQCHLRYQGS
jgi:membrane protease YdiL (CAAX protease family)